MREITFLEERRVGLTVFYNELLNCRKMQKEYMPFKNIWTEEDFNQMGWHDSRIYKLRVGKSVEMDIDYILEWNEPEMVGMAFTFWIVPATLVFDRITDFSCESVFYMGDIEIENIEKQVREEDVQWIIKCHSGEFSFIAPGYSMFIRQKPFFSFEQTISLCARGGCSLERTTNQDNPYRLGEEYTTLQKKEWEHYSEAKRRHFNLSEIENLERLHENKAIDLKKYLIRKRALNKEIAFSDSFLKGSIWDRTSYL